MMRNKVLLFVTLIFFVLITLAAAQFDLLKADTLNDNIFSNDNSVQKSLIQYNDDKNMPDDYRLMQNYPNPFNPTTIIKYSVPDGMHISIKVYNSLGNQVATLVDKTQEAGEHSVVFSGENLSSGVYFAQLKAEKFTRVIKMILVK